MEIVGTSSFQRRRAVAVSVALLTALLSGFGPTNAYAETVVVEGTVDGCVITISGSGTVDLGPPTLHTPEGSSSYWEFEKADAISVTWSTGSVNDCTGSLHAQHGGITKSAFPSSANLSLSLNGTDWVLLRNIFDSDPVQVDTSDNNDMGDFSDFDAMMTVDTSEGHGEYRATITFTVVAE